MCDLERIERMAAKLRTWVETERTELERTGAEPTQAYLRRARIADYLAEPDFWEAIRELQGIGDDSGENSQKKAR